ncbi:hypothetical protein SERLA73DRAFT_174411 [Serpula lacrymans var. lacrymans S7.3]|uniref:Uncharacterized protein n=1 Tax=Serpula lacrymans var. lacrymans (strain S7.3) TaxID=936435 RepID=F8PFM4_SERL3|nr:hypothetical protein SERLA73DRAFT_174411 [Serpula lacrymans var. lacrymans S7.3]
MCDGLLSDGEMGGELQQQAPQESSGPPWQAKQAPNQTQSPEVETLMRTGLAQTANYPLDQKAGQHAQLPSQILQEIAYWQHKRKIHDFVELSYVSVPYRLQNGLGLLIVNLAEMRTLHHCQVADAYAERNQGNVGDYLQEKVHQLHDDVNESVEIHQRNCCE